MRRVLSDEEWTLVCPAECPGLDTSYGEDFEALYRQYEREGKGRRTVRARCLWRAILDAQVETGMPYILFKDNCNKKSNQKNLGTIKCSNLCAEIVQYTSSDEVAVCNLASISLPKFIKGNMSSSGERIDLNELRRISEIVTRNLNRLIDRTIYPIEEAEKSNMRHRPIGIGVQGLADVFQMLRIPFDSHEARKINREIFETIYFGAVSASCQLAREDGTYETYSGSPAEKGALQFDLWGVEPDSGNWDWVSLKEKVAEYGLRNSLLIALMPTASTAQILGNNESTDPFTSNMYTRRVLAGEFCVVNKHLVCELSALRIWTPTVHNQIIADGGSVQNVKEIPLHIKEVFKTAWELSQKSVVDMAADRGPYICQSQSTTLYVGNPTIGKLTSMHFYSWKSGLKTGMYYLRTRPKANPIQFTIDKAGLTGKRDSQDDNHCFKCSA
jgi:ribonucleoside-diphosphate reductase alpha subunit